MSEIRTRTVQGLQAGDTFTVSRCFTEQDMVAFADITQDYNAVHFDVITSYSIHYTKLYETFLQFFRRASSAMTVLDILKIIVITSYSIHYTKLYETFLC